ncbi:transposase-like protein [Beauveria bassiana ARSEF 2860]|uniref:Transposase-like protein n=1 Tax=Beauveria bassiana (strain ARSEF 2860) TaxID=655819 RepID=J4KKT4_BEAB2|nr:transposase-like protein [Beauveria bassiana ARSEF 2860]EJP61009.1 transposase-like protein [Beauveria bassiana ARSEF 2860]
MSQPIRCRIEIAHNETRPAKAIGCFWLIITSYPPGTQGVDSAAPMYNSGWAKLDKYYRLTDESPAYVAAIVLHPSYEWHYIHENWKREWVAPSKTLVAALWDEYKPVETLPLSEPEPMATNEFLQWRNKHLQPAPMTDEYEHYCKSERVYKFTGALTWWLEETQQKTYPNLSKMAVDILSIPAMSAEPERLFSGTRITITDRRNRMGSDVIEATECLKSWFGIRDFEGMMSSEGRHRRERLLPRQNPKSEVLAGNRNRRSPISTTKDANIFEPLRREISEYTLVNGLQDAWRVVDALRWPDPDVAKLDKSLSRVQRLQWQLQRCDTLEIKDYSLPTLTVIQRRFYMVQLMAEYRNATREVHNGDGSGVIETFAREMFPELGSQQRQKRWDYFQQTAEPLFQAVERYGYGVLIFPLRNVTMKRTRRLFKRREAVLFVTSATTAFTCPVLTDS